jgi:hypothetical protein
MPTTVTELHTTIAVTNPLDVREQQLAALHKAYGERVRRYGTLVLLDRYDVTDTLRWHHEAEGLDLEDLIEHVEACLAHWEEIEAACSDPECDECGRNAVPIFDLDDPYAN